MQLPGQKYQPTGSFPPHFHLQASKYEFSLFMLLQPY